MGKSLKSDPFVLAVAEIAANERAKYFFEWLAQARIDVVASVREAGYSAESASRAAAQSELLDSLLNSIAEAGEIAGADVSVCVKAGPAAFWGELKPFSPRRCGGSSESQTKSGK